MFDDDDEFDDSGNTESFECVYKHETDRAYLLEIDGEERWIPKSVCTLSAADCEKGEDVSAEIASWFVEREM